MYVCTPQVGGNMDGTIIKKVPVVAIVVVVVEVGMDVVIGVDT